MLLTKIILFVAVFLLSRIDVSFADCDLYDLKGKDIGNVKETPTGILKNGDNINIYCSRPYGSLVNGLVQSSFKVFCREGSYLDVTGRCDLACDVADVLASKNKVDLKRTKLTDGSPIGASKLVPQNSRIQVVCLPDHTLELNSEPKKTEYIYECGKPDEQIFKCKANELVIEKNPPVSNQNTGFVPKLPCYASNINIPNGVIGSSSISEYVAPGTEVEIKCQAGYSAFLGDKIIQKFKIQCDTTGKGIWQHTQACIKRCDVSSLAKASKVDIDKVFFSTSKDLVKNKNDSSSQIIYTNIGSKIDLHCNDGDEIREIGKSFYTTECIDGSNFSVGDKVPVCQKKIPPCNNYEIQVSGILQDSKLKDATTNIGQKISFKCQGDGANQKGFYFKNGSNDSKGDEGVPICEYDDVSKTSKWSHKTFKCYPGCISVDGNTKIPSEQTIANIEKTITPATIRVRHYDEEASQNGSNSTIKLGVNMNWIGFNRLLNPFKISDVFNEFGMIKDTSPRCSSNSSLCNTKDATFGLIYKQNMEVHLCQSSQTTLETVNMNYSFVKFGYSRHKDATTWYLSWIGFTGNEGNCRGTSGINEGIGSVCVDKIKNDYGFTGDGKPEKKTLTTSSIISSNQVNTSNSICNNLFAELTPVPSHSKCKGFGEYWVGSCANYRNAAIMQEEGECIARNTTLRGSRWDKSGEVANPGSIGSRMLFQ